MQMTNEDRTEVSAGTRAEDDREAEVQAGADRGPTPEEEKAADEAAAALDGSELVDVGEHHREMDHLGAEVKGEGSVS
jgi:hypothetical protein